MERRTDGDGEWPVRVSAWAGGDGGWVLSFVSIAPGTTAIRQSEADEEWQETWLISRVTWTDQESSSRSGYVCVPNSQQCELVITSTSSLLSATCSDGSSILTNISIPYTATASKTVETVTAITAYAALVQLVYQASDNPTTTLSGTAAATSTAAPSDVGGGLSLGTSVGIGVGVGVGAVVVAGAVGFVWWRKRKRRLQGGERSDDGGGEGTHLTGEAGSEGLSVGKHRRSELPGSNEHRAGGSEGSGDGPYELSGLAARAELE